MDFKQRNTFFSYVLAMRAQQLKRNRRNMLRKGGATRCCAGIKILRVLCLRRNMLRNKRNTPQQHGGIYT